jgi:predicted phosphoadenosine phosphosulfate sulfurtransferase
LKSGDVDKEPLKVKVRRAKEKIIEFLEFYNGKSNELPVISFSGGKDSCVLRHLVFECQKELKMLNQCRSITSYEIFHPETLNFINKHKNKKDELMSPIKNFRDIIKQNGYPVISKQLAQKIYHIRTTLNQS